MLVGGVRHRASPTACVDADETSALSNRARVKYGSDGTRPRAYPLGIRKERLPDRMA